MDKRFILTDVKSKQKIKKVFYKEAKAFARLPVVTALAAVQAELNTQGIGVKIYDGYRPYAITVQFYESFPDSTYVASPWTGSKHNRGCALDMTLVDLKTGEEKYCLLMECCQAMPTCGASTEPMRFY